MLRDKAIIIIAVSKYSGSYGDLPGTITSARRMLEWANSDKDCPYKSLYLADDLYDKIDVKLVHEEVTKFINDNPIDRLIVYFAGHGIVRSAGSQFWLLTDASRRITEGIDVDAFQGALLKCNFGNADLPGQLCLIGDACRNTAQDSIDFRGDPILTSNRKQSGTIQLDKFLSTQLGRESFHINQEGSQSAYCIFSEVMLSALRGEVKDAIETKFHQFQPAVTNHRLAEYLVKEVSRRAALIGRDMVPDLTTGIHPPYNFYKKISDAVPKSTSTPYISDQLAAGGAVAYSQVDLKIQQPNLRKRNFKQQLAARFKGLQEIPRSLGNAIWIQLNNKSKIMLPKIEENLELSEIKHSREEPLGPKINIRLKILQIQLSESLSEIGHSLGEQGGDQLAEAEKHRRQNLLILKNNLTSDFVLERSRFNPGLFGDSSSRIETLHNIFTVNASGPIANTLDFSIASDFKPKFIAVPCNADAKVVNYRGFKLYQIETTGCKDSPILVRQNGRWIFVPNYPEATAVISNELPGDLLFFNTSATSKDELWDLYLSDFSNLAGNAPLRTVDAQKLTDNIRVGNKEYLHRAVAAGYLYESSNDHNSIVKIAHYMARASKTSAGNSLPFDLALLCADKIWWDQAKDGRVVAFADLPAVRPSQTTENAEFIVSYKNVPLWGIVPIFSRGWTFMQTELYLDVPEEIRLIGKNMNGRSVSSLTDKGLEMFLKTFHYRIVEIEP
jgi:Caspase domain